MIIYSTAPTYMSPTKLRLLPIQEITLDKHLARLNLNEVLMMRADSNGHT